MERNLALELVRVTEAAALASARWMGKGDGDAADVAAQEALSVVLRSVKIAGRVVIGDFSQGNLISNRQPSMDVPVVDVALDALQSIDSVAFGRPNAVSVVAVAEPDAFFIPPIRYMNKIAVGVEAAGRVDIAAPPLENLVNIADAKRCYVEDLTVCILARDRHAELIDQVRATGARIQLISDGDMAAAVATALPGSGVDVLMGVGGAAEGVLSAAALRCVGGEIQACMYPRDPAEKAVLRESGFGDAERVLRLEDLVGGENTMFAATGVTASGILRAVQFIPGGAVTHSIVMRSRSGTVRLIRSQHYFDRKPNYR